MGINNSRQSSSIIQNFWIRQQLHVWQKKSWLCATTTNFDRSHLRVIHDTNFIRLFFFVFFTQLLFYNFAITHSCCTLLVSALVSSNYSVGEFQTMQWHRKNCGVKRFFIKKRLLNVLQSQDPHMPVIRSNIDVTITGLEQTSPRRHATKYQFALNNNRMHTI